MSIFVEFLGEIGARYQVVTLFSGENHTNVPCKSTFEICRTADHIMKLDLLKGQFSFELIKHTIISSLNIDEFYENTDFGLYGHDKLELIDKIVDHYARHKTKMLTKSIKDIKTYQDRMTKQQEEQREKDGAPIL